MSHILTAYIKTLLKQISMHVLILGPICPQPMKIWEETPLPLKVPTEVSEECLYLNVWTSTLDTDARLPVMLWIHGGGFVAGKLESFIVCLFLLPLPSVLFPLSLRRMSLFKCMDAHTQHRCQIACYAVDTWGWIRGG